MSKRRNIAVCFVMTIVTVGYSGFSFGGPAEPFNGNGLRSPKDVFYSPKSGASSSAARSQNPASGPRPADGLASSQEAVDARQEAEDTGHTEKLDAVKALVGPVQSALSGVSPEKMTVPGLAGLQETLGAFTYYSNLHGTCVKTQATASTLCREKTSPHLQKSLNDINTVMGMIGGVAVKDACSNMAKIMRLGQAGLTAYTAACSAARAACEGSCTSANSNLKRILMAMKKTPPPLMSTCVPIDPADTAAATACSTFTTATTSFTNELAALTSVDSNPEDLKSIARKDKACTYEYANMLLSAGVGIASVMSSLQQSKGCDEQTNGTGVVAKEEEKAKCADPKNAALPECICMANPRTPGCSNGYTKPGETSAASLIAGNNASGGGSTVGKGTGPSTLGGSAGAENPMSGFGGDSGSGSGGGAVAGGGGGGGLGGGGGMGDANKAAGDGAEDKKGLNANILGSAGGGGGGGGSGGSWNSVRGSGAASAYRAYLPGGAKDPARGLAGQQTWAREVTGQGGKSNWEKVRERYRDNKNSLLSN